MAFFLTSGIVWFQTTGIIPDIGRTLSIPGVNKTRDVLFETDIKAFFTCLFPVKNIFGLLIAREPAHMVVTDSPLFNQVRGQVQGVEYNNGRGPFHNHWPEKGQNDTYRHDE